MSIFKDNPLNRFFEKLSSRSVLGDEERKAILALPGHPVQVQAHRDLVHLGEQVTYACLVVDGLIGRYGQRIDGQRQIVAVHIPGDMADLHSVVVPYSVSGLCALTTSTVLKVPHSALRATAHRYPAIAEAFWRESVIDASILAEWLVNIGRREARARVAHLLCEMADRYEAADLSGDKTFGFPVTQMHLAEMLGLTSVHINRTLRALRELGLAELRGRSVTINDWERLVDIGEFDPAYLQIVSPAPEWQSAWEFDPADL